MTEMGMPALYLIRSNVVVRGDGPFGFGPSKSSDDGLLFLC